MDEYLSSIPQEIYQRYSILHELIKDKNVDKIIIYGGELNLGINVVTTKEKKDLTDHEIEAIFIICVDAILQLKATVIDIKNVLEIIRNVR